ncbi:hypothetical protein QWZ08_01975 [Ferruginibacter paludis]|uniref:hypothetical protein n=1 Tax=Ferruginibacter paludis TaxID=1310417 RepID=UPI0025B59BF9|nr:hypothetical protein [Ferruginibacter paludis]MDN3654374.1 hypothetical protein [Ferruginibacter paludis]
MTQLSSYDSILVAENFDTTNTNADKSCLYYKGKPLLAFGQNINLFDTTFSFRYDPNGSYQNFHRQGITDYLSLDDFYSTKLSTGTIDGAMYFTTDKQKRIFKLNISFNIDAELVDTSGMEIMNYLHDKYFPCLPPDFKGKQVFELTHKNFVEQFRLYPSPDSADVEHGFKPHWSLDYSLRPTKKNGL